MTIELLAVSADDWRAWRSVRIAALTDAPGAFGSRLQDWADAPDGRWRERLSIPGSINLLAVDVDGSAPVGMATGTPATDRGSRAELISMWVDPAVRSRGVATALITAIARWAASTGAATLALSVRPNNVEARRAYERNGFTVSDELGDLLPGGQRELVMLRDLSPERTVSD
ncbi:GNAT family N-acetyltransferase [Cryobacterium sp. TMT1-21]|uniref:GNAT family N-acetyltransferase n=1 Tax=Cryobacterium shii TaxID=1259235 RepID=A0AAQ2C416_9MICO|nr:MULTISPECIES: GNAT family N-acetyltransferase [Cryobacterium]TFC42510.1 GNAT family N-acetyltransferase [Cryobacterium shii]TFC80842.1 GNAT family N-acetyltransferase [Cryobacterium sp. TmT2-59]TFD13231.1 GNAT family N-acetyltransferase [Cryobacterium sp. TMT1-21]TFD28453.1 GNAT family N-acetyltransferase [Cryobacterium sp. TMT2-23]TFD35423.1 GNAT family N-acetyltransferase [Cryobacterium sp. TMT2-10]